MALAPSFAVYPIIGNCIAYYANTDRSSITGLAILASGAASGTRIAEIVAQATGTTVAGLIGIHLSGVGITTGILPTGTPIPLFDEITIAAATPSASTKATRISTTYNNLVLESGQFLLARNTINQGINVIALGADL